MPIPFETAETMRAALARMTRAADDALHYFDGDGSGHPLAWQDGGVLLAQALSNGASALNALLDADRAEKLAPPPAESDDRPPASVLVDTLLHDLRRRGLFPVTLDSALRSQIRTDWISLVGHGPASDPDLVPRVDFERIEERAFDAMNAEATLRHKFAALKARAEQLENVLLSLEWSAQVDVDDGGTVAGCPVCEGYQPPGPAGTEYLVGHDDSCAIALALRGEA